MRIAKTLILILITTMGLVAQDTITINTFTWSSESRDSVFEFPDVAGQTYHKIIMEYGMRCHDLAVGNGATGCREWDYSCNTIIYDSTRTDSVLVDNGNGALVYETSTPVRYEIMSFVTPYGNGLDLGPEGKTWTFDVTDYAPILKGRKRMALVGGGEFQEEMQITFKFITGTPEREVIDIRPIWPLQFGVSGDPIINDLRFEPRDVEIPANVSHVKIKSVITGHGQTGEFTPFQHRLDINNDRRVTYRIWKECSDVPVYPQGGTWLLDRAGWCPGDPSQVNTVELTESEMSGGSFNIDYSVRDIVQAPDLRYIVNHQMVFYGPYNFNNDLSLHDIIRPNDQVEHARFNPVCFKPRVVIRNGGKEVINYASIEYGVVGGEQLTYSWGGELHTGETDTIDLEYPEEMFTSLQGPAHFVARIVQDDDHTANNSRRVTFEPVAHYTGERVLMLLTTNKAPKDNELVLKDAQGNVMLRYADLEASRSYFDEVSLAPGCYELLLTDSRDDGLYYWAYEQNGPNIGRGGLEIFVDDVSVHEFEPEFGRFVQYAFAIESATATRPTQFSRLKIYPNPTRDVILIDAEGEPGPGKLTIRTLDGRPAGTYEISGNDEKIDISHLPPGAYMLILQREGRHHRTTMIKQ